MRMCPLCALLLASTAQAEEPPPPSQGWSPFQFRPVDRTDETLHFGLLAGLGYRGVLAEQGSFRDQLTVEGGVRLLAGVRPALDIAMAGGHMFREGTPLRLDVHARMFLPFFEYGYFGGGYVFRGNPKRGYGTLGVGHKAFVELQVREGAPVAAILSLGFRFPFL